jgi:hypothetical protein
MLSMQGCAKETYVFHLLAPRGPLIPPVAAALWPLPRAQPRPPPLQFDHMLDQPPGQQGFGIGAEIAAGDHLANSSAQLVIVTRPILGLVVNHTLGNPREQRAGQLL